MRQNQENENNNILAQNEHMNGTKDPEINPYTATITWFLTKYFPKPYNGQDFSKKCAGEIG